MVTVWYVQVVTVYVGMCDVCRCTVTVVCAGGDCVSMWRMCGVCRCMVTVWYVQVVTM